VNVRASKDTVVTIEYAARLDDGRLIDSTGSCGPVTYLHGNEQIFPALEEAVEGLAAGEERTLRLPPSASYGERREDLVRRMPRAQLPPDLPLVAGERYSVRGTAGQQLVFQLLAIDEDEVVVDFNNRAAGLGLEIRARVVAVRSATPDELRRGTLR
jgi:FKBP-type peptidyl-prolyl cis-trans isomerase 2